MQNKNLKAVIDLRSQYFAEELEKNSEYKVKKKKYFSVDIILRSIVISWFLLFFLTIYLNYFHIWKAEAKNFTLQEKIRISRLKACQKFAKTEKTYWQDSVARCATFATIVFAFESNFWKSKMCENFKNCYWMKWNWIEYPSWFIKFENYKKADEYFAKKYWQWHYKKKIDIFIKWKCQNWKCIWAWSETDQETYIYFFNKNFKKIYKEILDLKIRK